MLSCKLHCLLVQYCIAGTYSVPSHGMFDVDHVSEYLDDLGKA